MPFWNYVNVDDSSDIFEDAIFCSADDRPKVIEKDGNKYVYKAVYPTASAILKGGGWTSNSRIQYASKEDMAQMKKNEENKKMYREFERKQLQEKHSAAKS